MQRIWGHPRGGGREVARSLWLKRQSGSPRQVRVVKNATHDVGAERGEGGRTPGLHGWQGKGATKDITEKEGRRRGWGERCG